MNEIRKVWIGKDIKTDSMSWEVGQKVGLGRENGFGVIHHMKEETPGTVTIWVKKEDSVVKWKTSNMALTIEYNIGF